MGGEQDLEKHLGEDSLLLQFHACSEVYLTEDGHLTLGEVLGVSYGRIEVYRAEGWL